RSMIDGTIQSISRPGRWTRTRRRRPISESTRIVIALSDAVQWRWSVGTRWDTGPSGTFPRKRGCHPRARTLERHANPPAAANHIPGARRQPAGNDLLDHPLRPALRVAVLGPTDLQPSQLGQALRRRSVLP